MSNRTVLPAKVVTVVVKTTPLGEPPPHVLADLPVGVKLGHVMTDILVRGVAQQVELGLVGPQYPPVRAHLMQAFHRVLEEVGELFLDAIQGLLELTPL